QKFKIKVGISAFKILRKNFVADSRSVRAAMSPHEKRVESEVFCQTFLQKSLECFAKLFEKSIEAVLII
ncbi:MAG: hypothetical protein Q4D53_02275, partial [Leptotrichiaceae bacterium]|nr:hypothetical protein [Leptotrichiaceae bacterium]